MQISRDSGKTWKRGTIVLVESDAAIGPFICVTAGGERSFYLSLNRNELECVREWADNVIGAQQ